MAASSTPISGSAITFTGGANTGAVNAEGLSYARTVTPISLGQNGCTTDATGACTLLALFPLDDQLNFSALIPGGLTLAASGFAGDTVVFQAALNRVTMSGTITDDTGAPLAGASVSLGPDNAQGTAANVTTGADGTYSMSVFPATLTLNVHGNAQLIHVKGLNITADLVEDFSFASTGTVSVSTIDADSTPISGSMIKFTGGANTGTVNAEGLSYARTIAPIGGGGGSCTTDSTGACVFPALFPLDDQLNFSALIPGGLTLTGSGTASAAGSTVVIQTSTTTAPPKVTMSGTITDDTGAPLAGASISLGPDDAQGTAANVTTGADGTYSMSGFRRRLR